VNEQLLRRAAEAIAAADALLIGAGAGMGVDSGLPDFRGDHGFWKAYPPYQKLGLNFVSLANPRWFRTDPALAWGFYGHRMMLYRATAPHDGFQILQRWSERMKHGGFVFTSNVDGHFQRAGVAPDRIAEVHGSFAAMQCLNGCGAELFPRDAVDVTIDESTMRAHEPLPACPQCGDLARPNILMFGDFEWNDARTAAQMAKLEGWVSDLTGRVVVVECGAGAAIPTVRNFCERIAEATGGTLIRLNIREPEVPHGQIGLAMGALAGLRAIDERLEKNPG
jgi:NAD-dependent SIR2 family protein deacetylase